MSQPHPKAPVNKTNQPALGRYGLGEVTYALIYRAPCTLNRWSLLADGMTMQQAEEAMKLDIADIQKAVVKSQTLSGADEYPREYKLIEVTVKRNPLAALWVEGPISPNTF